MAEKGIAMRDLMGAIADGLGIPARSIRPDEADAYFGWFAMFARMDNPSSSAITQAELGWRPRGPTTLDDLRHQNYFAS